MSINYIDAFDPEKNKIEGEAEQIEFSQQPEPEIIEDIGEESIEPIQEEVHSLRKNAHERISQLQREKYQSLAEIERLKQQMGQLHNAAQASYATATTQYNEALVQRMARLKEEKLKAREENDIEAEANADIALSLLASEFSRAQSLQPQQTQQQYQPQQYQQPHNQTPPPNYAGEVQRWANENQWFHPASKEYDPELSNHIHNFCNAFDANLMYNGRGNSIFSPEYLRIISEEAERVRNLRREQTGELNMQRVRGGVSRVNSGYNRQGAQRESSNLNQDQKDLARRLGIDEKTYRKFALEDSKHQAMLGRR